MNCPTREQIKTAVKAKGYKWFENGDYNLNGITIVSIVLQTRANIGLKTL